MTKQKTAHTHKMLPHNFAVCKSYNTVTYELKTLSSGSLTQISSTDFLLTGVYIQTVKNCTVLFINNNGVHTSIHST